MKDTHLALGQVLAARLAVRAALAEIIALVGCILVVFVVALVLLDGLDELSRLFGHEALLLPALLLLGLLVLERGNGDDPGLELIEAQLIRVLFRLPRVLHCLQRHQALLSLLLAHALLVQHFDVFPQALSNDTALLKLTITISAHFSGVKAMSFFSSGQ